MIKVKETKKKRKKCEKYFFVFFLFRNFALEIKNLLFNPKKLQLMKTKKNAAAQQAAPTATEKKNRSNSRTVKNQSKKATAATDPTAEEEKKTRRAAAAKKAAETRRKNREEEARRMEEEKKRAAAEEAARQKAEAKKEKETAREERKTDAATWTAARKEVKEARTPLYYMHNLNRLATGKSDSRPDGLNMTALMHCYNQLQELTETANHRDGFSFNAVKVDSRGRICKMVTAPADIDIISYSGTIRVNTRTAQDIDMIDTYAGYYCLIPVKVDEIGILTAAQSVVMYYNDVARDSRNRYRTTTTRQEMKEATTRRHRNTMKLKAEKMEREAMKEAARTAREAAEADTTPAAVVELQPTQTATPRRRWWHNIAASLF